MLESNEMQNSWAAGERPKPAAICSNLHRLLFFVLLSRMLPGHTVQVGNNDRPGKCTGAVVSGRAAQRLAAFLSPLYPLSILFATRTGENTVCEHSRRVQNRRFSRVLAKLSAAGLTIVD